MQLQKIDGCSSLDVCSSHLQQGNNLVEINDYVLAHMADHLEEQTGSFGIHSASIPPDTALFKFNLTQSYSVSLQRNSNTKSHLTLYTINNFVKRKSPQNAYQKNSSFVLSIHKHQWNTPLYSERVEITQNKRVLFICQHVNSNTKYPKKAHSGDCPSRSHFGAEKTSLYNIRLRKKLRVNLCRGKYNNYCTYDLVTEKKIPVCKSSSNAKIQTHWENHFFLNRDYKLVCIHTLFNHAFQEIGIPTTTRMEFLISQKTSMGFLIFAFIHKSSGLTVFFRVMEQDLSSDIRIEAAQKVYLETGTSGDQIIARFEKSDFLHEDRKTALELILLSQPDSGKRWEFRVKENNACDLVDIESVGEEQGAGRKKEKSDSLP